MTTIVIEKNLMVPMRDGVRLTTDVYRLDGAAPAPVLLTRTPYDKEHTLQGSSTFTILRAVQAGYVVAIQDVRGRYASEGTFNAHIQEGNDGADTVNWLATQPWSSGVVGGFGGSYLGCTQWLAAREQPAALRALAPSVNPADMYNECSYQGGVKVLHDLRWVVGSIIPGELRRRAARGEAVPDPGAPFDLDSVFSELPLGSHPLIPEAAPFYAEWLEHETADTYWEPTSPLCWYEQVATPVFNIGGWFDAFLWSALQHYQGMRERGGTDTARRNQRLVIGPWTHMNFTGSFPEREFGASASSDAIDLTGMQLRWFDRWLKNEENDVEHEPPVMIFVMGLDQWRTASDWPLPDTQFRPYFLHSAGQANSLQGDGTLSEQKPGDERPDVYLSDPLRPVPTVGGQVILPGGNAAGPRDQRAVEERCD
ncbi:MAG TPA: CocE/NonD family hydrolase, partial [Roseiflexaceae bacterium]|nr:CocE/NonD family hydrolase [Roseiflexaceae bacterium]